MSQEHVSPPFYIAYITIMLQAKAQVIAVGAEFDLTVMQTLTLLTMTDVEDMSMSNFSKLYDCDASNVTGIVDGLEQKKLVTRHLHPKDRRIKMIHIEPAGIAMQQKLLARLTETSDYLTSSLTAAERKRFTQLIMKIGTNLRNAEHGVCPKAGKL